MGRSLAERDIPRIRPITDGTLTDAERRRLQRIVTVYPLLEWVSARELRRLAFERWYWHRRGGDQ